MVEVSEAGKDTEDMEAEEETEDTEAEEDKETVEGEFLTIRRTLASGQSTASQTLII